jgi:hypothetical protein
LTVTFLPPAVNGQATPVFLVNGSGTAGSGSAIDPPATLVPLTVAVVTTGGVAVTAIAAGNRTRGGLLVNPSATNNMVVNEITTASGTVTSGSNFVIPPGGSWVLAASGNAVSVISADSGHVFAGYGKT